jgi:hypothetical protein
MEVEAPGQDHALPDAVVIVDPAGSAKLNPVQQPTAAALMEQGPVDPKADFLKTIDMTQLHRCVLLHTSLGKLNTFQVSLYISLFSPPPTAIQLENTHTITWPKTPQGMLQAGVG